MNHSGCVYRSILYGIIWIICFKGYDYCRFGSEPNCGFPCRCTGNNICDSDNGTCLDRSQCQSVGPLPVEYGWKGPGCLVGNVAYGKTNVNQSGQYLHYNAGLAVDGDTTAIISNAVGESCAHPFQADPFAWWWVDLGDVYNIQSITIVNRLTTEAQSQELFNARSTNYEIKIGSTSDRSKQALCFNQNKNGNTVKHTETFTCVSGDMVGRFVSFARNGGMDPTQAAICEFIIIGHKYIECQHCDGTCDSIRGCEACVAGKMLPDCTQECPGGYWGVNCANECGMCQDGVTCDKETGLCGEQCDGIYIPEMCTKQLVAAPTTSNDKVSQITSNTATVTWERSTGYDEDIQQYFYYTVGHRTSDGMPWQTTEHLPLTNTSFQYDLSGLEFNTNYIIQIVSHRAINGITEEGQIKTHNFKTLCKEPGTPPTPSSSGTPNIFTITWNLISDLPSGCDSIETLRVSITCENSTHTTDNVTYDVPTANTSFTYEAADAIDCDVMLIVINNQDLSATSAVTSVATTTTKIITTPPIAISSISSIIVGVTNMQMTAAPQNMALIAGAAAGGGAVFIALIIIIPVVVILRRRKNKPKSKKDEEPNYDEVKTTSQTFNINLITEKQSKPKPEQKPPGIQYHNVDDRAIGGEYEEVGNITSSQNEPVASKASSEDKSHSEPPRPERLPPKPKPQQKPKPQVTPKVEPKFKLEDTDTKVLLTRLENYIKKKKEERGAFKKEYDALPTDHKHPCNTGIAKGNVDKNRFKNIVAYDHSRVILDTIDDDPLSDYVNANYLPGHSGGETYIASQGPKPEHVKDFWRMIWLKDMNRIVMVTNEVEGNKKKCDRYWPLHVDTKLEHGDITILSLATEVYADFTIRVMKLTKQNESRQVRQFHFTSWHDKRIPDYAFPLLIFRHKIRSYDASATGPMLVHCSAGIGRTGTFIAIDYLMDQARKYDAIDVFSFVNKMRANRVNMIQTLEQYIFVYDTILEAQMVGETAIPCSEMDARYPELIETGEYQNISQLEKEYKELQKFHPEPEGKQFSALSSANSDKNRNKNIYPSDVTRPFLVKHPGEDSDYINAVYIDGYTKNKAFIVTQLPLENTVIEFWRMITDHNSTTVIVLEPQTVPFIPTTVKSPEQHGNVEVTLLSEKTIKHVKIQDLSVRTPYGTGEPMLVTIYHTLSWTDKDFPKLNEILQLLQLLEKRQRDMHESPCTIQCLNGVSRSGVLISILYAIDRMRVDQEIDIFHSVKSVRINRNQFVESLAQYEYIYKSVQSYRAQFDTYANFD